MKYVNTLYMTPVIRVTITIYQWKRLVYARTQASFIWLYFIVEKNADFNFLFRSRVGNLKKSSKIVFIFIFRVSRNFYYSIYKHNIRLNTLISRPVWSKRIFSWILKRGFLNISWPLFPSMNMKDGGLLIRIEYRTNSWRACGMTSRNSRTGH